MDLEGVIAIIGFFGCIPLTVWMVLNHKYKVKSKASELVSAMIAKDKEITPELIKSIGFTPKRRHADLRTGLILLAIGLAFFFFGGIIPDDEAQSILSGLAMFPILIAFALLAFWYFISRKDEI